MNNQQTDLVDKKSTNIKKSLKQAKLNEQQVVVDSIRQLDSVPWMVMVDPIQRLVVDVGCSQ